MGNRAISAQLMDIAAQIYNYACLIGLVVNFFFSGYQMLKNFRESRIQSAYKKEAVKEHKEITEWWAKNKLSKSKKKKK